ncbi:NUDIX hydrolase, partial [Streptomyces toxytricini]
PGRPPLVAYLFDGGVLDAGDLASIRLQEAELLSWRLVAPAELPDHLPGPLGRRALEACRVLESGEGAVELENGRRPAAS